MNKTRPLLALALVAGAFFALRFVGGAGGPELPLVQPTSADRSASRELLGPTGSESRELHLPNAAERQEAPGVAFVRNYYGADAAEVLAKIEAAGMDLATLLPPTPEAQMHAAMPRWFQLREDQREREYEGQWAWPAEGASNAYLAKHFVLVRDLGPGELQALDALAASYDPDIRAAADSYFQTLELALAQKVGNREYHLSPFVAWPPVDDSLDDGHRFRATTKIGEGWVVRMSLEVDRFPEVIAAREAVHGASNRRHRDLAETIRMLTE